MVTLGVIGLIVLLLALFALYGYWLSSVNVFEYIIFNQGWMNLFAGILSLIGELLTSLNDS